MSTANTVESMTMHPGGVTIWEYFSAFEESHPWGNFITDGGLCLVSGENGETKNFYAHKLATGAADGADVFKIQFEDQNGEGFFTDLNEIVESVLDSKAKVVSVENANDAFRAKVCRELLKHGLSVFAAVDSDAKENIVSRFHELLKNDKDSTSASLVPVLAAYYEVRAFGNGPVINGAYHGYGFLNIPA